MGVFPGGPALSFSNPEALLEALKARADAVHSLKAIAKIKVSSSQRNFSGSEAVVMRKPMSLRLEALGPFGQTVHLFVTDGQRLTIYWPEAKRAYIGRASYENIARFLPLGLDNQELVSILFGESSRLKHAPSALSLAEREGLYILSFISLSDGVKELWWVDPRGPVLTKREVYDPYLGLVFQTYLSDFQPAGPVIFPRKLEVVFPGQMRIEISYRDITLNSNLDESLFSFSMPKNGEVTILDEEP